MYFPSPSIHLPTLQWKITFHKFYLEKTGFHCCSNELMEKYIFHKFRGIHISTKFLVECDLPLVDEFTLSGKLSSVFIPYSSVTDSDWHYHKLSPRLLSWLNYFWLVSRHSLQLLDYFQIQGIQVWKESCWSHYHSNERMKRSHQMLQTYSVKEKLCNLYYHVRFSFSKYTNTWYRGCLSISNIPNRKKL